MPRRDDSIEAYWVLPPRASSRGEVAGPALRNPPETVIERIDAKFGRVLVHDTHEKARDIEPSELPHQIYVHLRDRLGFHYTRVVGLDDYISQATAARLLHVPIMTIHRWVRDDVLASRKLKGVRVIRVHALRDLAIAKGRKLRIGIFTESRTPWFVG